MYQRLGRPVLSDSLCLRAHAVYEHIRLMEQGLVPAAPVKAKWVRKAAAKALLVFFGDVF